ncbi:MAG: hypothetical protein V3V20_11610 [Algisphaera sp.]
MPLHVPAVFESTIKPVFAALPPAKALDRLVVDGPGTGSAYDAARDHVARAVADPIVAAHPNLIAGLWLHVDELARAHDAVEHVNTPTGAFWHAVVHRREGDFSNARYWYVKASGHPAMDRMDLTGGGAGSGTAVATYDADAFVGRVEKAYARGENNAPALQSMQHKEWKALFEWCLMTAAATAAESA